MFTTISWGNYLIAVALLSGAWYIYVGLRYYKNELLAFFHSKNKTGYGNKSPEGTAQENIFIDQPTTPPIAINELEDDTFQEVDHLIGRLKKLFSEVQSTTAKEEFTNYLGLLLAEYPLLAQSVFKSQVNEFILSEMARGNLSFQFTHQQLQQLW
ncbi:hypothetical protein AMR72_15400 [Flavobacterium psychrophilum]|nr:hypothetical protein AMR72_15400 [Flavobacterium psychrophilum]AOE53777.1 hypothetical protein ALW18_15390 [Flavobacterium psychrophilum]